MAVFTYEAVGTGGRRLRGLLRADTPRQARDELRDRGLAVSNLQVFTGKATSFWARFAALRRIVRETRHSAGWLAAEQLGRLRARVAIQELFDLVCRSSTHWERGVEALARLNDPAAAERVIAELRKKGHRTTHANALGSLAALSDPATYRKLETTKVPTFTRASIEDHVRRITAHTGVPVVMSAAIPEERRRAHMVARSGETELAALAMLGKATHALSLSGPPCGCFVEGGRVEILPLAEVYAAWDRWLARERGLAASRPTMLSAERLAELTAGLRSPRAPGRIAAVRGLGATRDARAVRSLLPLLGDPDPAMREAATEALLWVRHLRDLDTLTAAAKAEDPRTQLGAIEALGRINDARCVAPLAAAFADSDVAVREQAAWALARLPNRLGAEPLRARLDDDDSRIRFTAAVALFCSETGASIDLLLARTKNYCHWCPNGKCMMLHGFSQPLSADVVTLLLVLLKDDARCVRSRVVWALRMCRDPAVIDPLIVVLKGDPIDACRSGAARTLQSFNEPRVIRAFLDALKDRHGLVRAYAVQGLGRCKDPQAVEPLLAALKDPSPGMRRLATHAVRYIQTPTAVGAVLQRLADTDEKVRAAAASALSGYRGRWAVPVYIKALADADVRVRAKAAEMLRTISGQDFGEDRDRWSQWWREQGSGGKPKPQPVK